MIEVFKTSVCDGYYAKLLIRKIHTRFPGSRANFDLTDCDRILRVQTSAAISVTEIIDVVRCFGYEATVLPDEIVNDNRITARR